jgi:starch synthase
VLADMEVQFVVLGSGERAFEDYFWNLPGRYSGRAGSYIGYDTGRSHLISAGCDFFLMPSLFEPCGLNQMYAMHYGTLPIVHATGGLDDSVENYDETTGEGTGFKFHDPNPDALYYTIGWAVSTWYDRPEHIKKMIQRAMTRDFSWETSALQYEAVYKRAITNKARLDAGKKNYYW